MATVENGENVTGQGNTGNTQLVVLLQKNQLTHQTYKPKRNERLFPITPHMLVKRCFHAHMNCPQRHNSHQRHNNARDPFSKIEILMVLIPPHTAGRVLQTCSVKSIQSGGLHTCNQREL
jgi:hypothetical protein